MEARPKILLLDDDPKLLETYKELLAHLPSQPEICTATSGSRGLAMLENDHFRLLICDLKMPRMDGLQVLAIVRRKYPQLRTVALTAVVDEQFRSRAYALGVDLFWHKPTTESEIRMFLECLESLLGRDTGAGFRGMQSKSLVDIIQLECISQSSSVLRITNGPQSGRVWIRDGDLIDAEAGDLRGEDAFRRILSWRAGHFEFLAADPNHPRTIQKSYNGLLLETAQALDEQANTPDAEVMATTHQGGLAKVAKLEGVDFVLAAASEPGKPVLARGLENPEQMTRWTRQACVRFAALGDKLQTGTPGQIEAFGPQRHVSVVPQGETELCVGWNHSLSPGQVREGLKKATVLWAS